MQQISSVNNATIKKLAKLKQKIFLIVFKLTCLLLSSNV